MIRKFKIALAILVGIPVLFFGVVFIYVLSHPSIKTNQEVSTSTSPVATRQTSLPTQQTTVLGATAVPVINVEVAKSTRATSATPTITPTPTLSPTTTPTPTATPKLVTPKPVTPTPTIYKAIVTSKPSVNTGGSYICNCSKTCTQISSCAEAQYLLNVCGCTARDADHDGIACDSAPLHCQN